MPETYAGRELTAACIGSKDLLKNNRVKWAVSRSVPRFTLSGKGGTGRFGSKKKTVQKQPYVSCTSVMQFFTSETPNTFMREFPNDQEVAGGHT